MKDVTIYTDGSCLYNPGFGGWGAVLIYKKSDQGEVIKKISGTEQNTTNNIMELSAVIHALESLKEECNVYLYTDSKYVQNGVTIWMENWKKANWIKSDKKAVKNVELWKRLDIICKRQNVKFIWIKGHSGDKYNEIADKLATSAAKSLQNLSF